MFAKRVQSIILVISVIVLVAGIGPRPTGLVQALPLPQQQDPPGNANETPQQPAGGIEPTEFTEESGEDEDASSQSGVQPAAYIISPTMNYQGYLTDIGGSPLNATLTFTASLYNDLTGGARMWGPEVHPGVQVQNGLFSLVLGRSVSLDPADFYNALYLQLEVNGTLLPRQTLRTVPYAFNLVPGAYMRGNLDAPLMHINNHGDDYALYVEENGGTDYGLGADKIYSAGGYASDADSYLWVPGNLAVTPDTPLTLKSWYYGRVEISRSSAGSSYVHIPIALLTQPYGHGAVVEEVRVYYYTTNSTSFINNTWVNKLLGADDSVVIASSDIDQNSTVATSYVVPIDSTSPYTLTSASGPLSVNLQVTFDDPSHRIYIGGVRVRLGHPRTD